MTAASARSPSPRPAPPASTWAPAGYYGWNDWVYGEWVGELRVEGSHLTDCDKPETARKLHQLRDLLVRVEDPVGGGVGLGNAETFALGEIPELGLTAENSFL